jgi:hypothetical protein
MADTFGFQAGYSSDGLIVRLGGDIDTATVGSSPACLQDRSRRTVPNLGIEWGATADRDQHHPRKQQKSQLWRGYLTSEGSVQYPPRSFTLVRIWTAVTVHSSMVIGTAIATAISSPRTA